MFMRRSVKINESLNFIKQMLSINGKVKMNAKHFMEGLTWQQKILPAYFRDYRLQFEETVRFFFYFFDIIEMNHRRIYYVYDKKLIDVSRNIPNIGNRAAVVQSLIATYNLLQKCIICGCEEATDDDLLSFHSSEYVECLKKVQRTNDLEKITDSEEITDFNLGYDCPLFEDIYQFVKLIAGSSLTSARKLIFNNFQVRQKANWVLNSQPKSYLKFKLSQSKNSSNSTSDFSFDESETVECEDENIKKVQNKIYETEVKCLESNVHHISVNWFGGWHHAQRDEAGGFCYVNDIVIAIQYLLKYYRRVVYVDLDVHHGNGVENAFLFSSKVLTFSIHKHESGFYPASGSLEDIGKGKGMYYTVNVPLKSGITDDKYVNTFKIIFNKIIKRYQPDCIVVQCGADCLVGDPLGGFNLTLKGIGECLKLILNEKLSTMVLGGGGYNVANAARCWAYLTSLMVECPISNDIPENSFLHLYGPEYELNIGPSLRKDENSHEYLQTVVTTILQNLDKVTCS